VGRDGGCSGFILAMQGATDYDAWEHCSSSSSCDHQFHAGDGPAPYGHRRQRSFGSAFSAEIGSMVVTEEMDALRTMGHRLRGIRARRQISRGVNRGCRASLSSARVRNSGRRDFHCASAPAMNLQRLFPGRSAVNRHARRDYGPAQSIAFATIMTRRMLEGFRVAAGRTPWAARPPAW